MNQMDQANQTNEILCECCGEPEGTTEQGRFETDAVGPVHLGCATVAVCEGSR